MTTTYDPFHPQYFVESDLREEMTRVFDLCHGCRLCFKYCTSFPTLFAAIDRHDDQDAAKLTVAEQDQVVDECFQCKLCYVNCPYTPGQHEWALDFPRLMMRAEQVKHRNGRQGLRSKLTDQALRQTDLTGRIGSATSRLANATMSKRNTPVRKLLEKTVGIHADRVLPPFARQRFSTWFRKRKPLESAISAAGTGKVAAVFATCLVEYQDAQVGRDLVGVYERNGIECRLPEGQICCGAPALHQGDVDAFRRNAARNIEILARDIRTAQADGEDIAVVVAQPTCGYILKKDYVDYVGGDDAKLVADHTYDASEYLMAIHREDRAFGGTGLDTDFSGAIPETTTYHAPCHLRAQNVGLKSRDLMKLTGTKITVVAECSGIDGTWGLREENYEISRKVARRMAAEMERAGSEVIAGDCSLANGGIVLETGQSPVHPLSLVARAYGIPEEP